MWTVCMCAVVYIIGCLIVWYHIAIKNDHAEGGIPGLILAPLAPFYVPMYLLGLLKEKVKGWIKK